MRSTRFTLVASLALGLLCPAAALAQESRTEAEIAAPNKPGSEIVVSASRIDRASYDQPTPTAVLGETELREGARASIAQVLNDQPQFKASSFTQSLVGNLQGGR